MFALNLYNMLCCVNKDNVMEGGFSVAYDPQKNQEKRSKFDSDRQHHSYKFLHH